MYQTSLAHIARTAELRVVEHGGWQQRGHGGMSGISGVVCHHTGAVGGSWLDVVINGRSDLPGPLCNYAVGQDGVVHVVAAGLAYHAGVVVNERWSNGHAIGIEAENLGVSPTWPAVQYDAYVRLVAAVIGHFGLPVAAVKGHKEIAYPIGRKDDPSFDMAAFRSAVASSAAASTSSPQEDPDMPFSCTQHQVPSGFAFSADGDLTDASRVLVLGTPLGGLTGLKAGWISFSCDFGAAQIRVALAGRTPAGEATWNVQTVTVDAAKARAVVNLPPGCDKVSLGRVPTSATDPAFDVPVVATLELAG